MKIRERQFRPLTDANYGDDLARGWRLPKCLSNNRGQQINSCLLKQIIEWTANFNNEGELNYYVVQILTGALVNDSGAAASQNVINRPIKILIDRLNTNGVLQRDDRSWQAAAGACDLRQSRVKFGEYQMERSEFYRGTAINGCATVSKRNNSLRDIMMGWGMVLTKHASSDVDIDAEIIGWD